jgi:hypothetical protein
MLGISIIYIIYWYRSSMTLVDVSYVILGIYIIYIIYWYRSSMTLVEGSYVILGIFIIDKTLRCSTICMCYDLHQVCVYVDT